MTALSLRERRLIAVGLLVLALTLVWLVLIGPLIGGFADRADARAALLDRYARDVRVTAQVASLRRTGQVQAQDRQRFTLIAASPTAASETLRAAVAAAITAAGGELRSIEELAPASGNLRARADCRLTSAQLAALLARLANATPVLRVDALTVVADAAFKTSRSGPMDVRLEIAGPYPAAAPR